jgi:hypothetical protein
LDFGLEQKMKCEYIGCANTATTPTDGRTYCGEHADRYFNREITDDQGNK